MDVKYERFEELVTPSGDIGRYLNYKEDKDKYVVEMDYRYRVLFDRAEVDYLNKELTYGRDYGLDDVESVLKTFYEEEKKED